MLGQGQVESDEVVGSHGDIPADLEGPGNDGFTEMGGWRTELRRGNGERRLPFLTRLEARGDRRLEKGVRREELAAGFHPALRVRDLGLRVVLVLLAADLIEPQPDQPKLGLPCRYRLTGQHSDPAGYAIADACRTV